MYSPMLSVQAATTSASLVQGACCDICPPVHEKYEAEFNPLHMNWVLVDDTTRTIPEPKCDGWLRDRHAGLEYLCTIFIGCCSIRRRLSRFKCCCSRLRNRRDRRILFLPERICADIGFPNNGGADQVVDRHNGLEE